MRKYDILGELAVKLHELLPEVPSSSINCYPLDKEDCIVLGHSKALNDTPMITYGTTSGVYTIGVVIAAVCKSHIIARSWLANIRNIIDNLSYEQTDVYIQTILPYGDITKLEDIKDSYNRNVLALGFKVLYTEKE